MKQEIINYSLHSATNDDIEFMFQLRLKTMKPFFENTHGWNDIEELEKAADELKHAKIVMVGEEQIGIIKVIPKTKELHLHQLQIQPEFQKMGLGAKLISKTIERSEKLQIPITLFVITSSPAKSLYDRFGFVIIEEFEHHCTMCRQPMNHLNN
ncbi:MAG: GNAT family N-acetyltransferase [Desulfobacteraceae bacterium]|nr:GNAT family N-acetyltransferase [Desulfobacteraceae bacterium]